ncbi:hypothetical protein [Naumannella halotolerans]|uniref:Uncharacterized protein n=1 Tax=Naumannella halotolerans TaxID=993414 RepID=A0A4R7J8Q4_9ACTN|nr:hypothetical protein [Naumannella halotolerans]TDT33891.1 hypothetical protein CLV29_1526 [Naumannella halotolerans]
MRVRFTGEITGIGSASGIRVVVGNWATSPFGTVADAMVETAAGHRILIAPTPELAEFIAETYVFDEVRVEPTDLSLTAHRRIFTSESLEITADVGSRTALGRVIALLPHRVSTSTAWCAITDLIARVIMPGVRTRGTAGRGRREWYGATDVRAICAITGRLDGTDLGSLAPVDPPCRFGFSSTPARPSLTRVVTTIELS